MLLFVYGTLLGKSEHAMSRLLSAHAQPISNGVFQGRLYQIDWYPGAIDSENPDDKVFGEIWSIPDDKALIHKLDDYEGYHPEMPEASEYIRTERSIITEKGESVACQIYLYQASLRSAKRIHGGRFVS
jgi:gamma-glutamylcyclotransferase (GGCT)/AIG2-like uncharacterized protein YtfP